jgi:hypothetical protein
MDHSAVRSSDPGNAVPAHQRRVDEMVAAVRKQPPPRQLNIFKPAPPTLQPSARLLDHRIAEELEYMARTLEQLGGVLSEDSILLIRHAASLQSIDLMQQVLGQLARVIAAQDKEAVADRITLTELKGRLQRKPLRALADEPPVAKQ